jgi:putative ABC transport system permease protein
MSLLPPEWTPAGIAARLRSVWRGLRRRESVEAEMEEEFRHHIELRTEALMEDEGLSRREAYRRARLEFGHVEGHREAARASRGLHWFDEVSFSWLDVKLGLRMLGKYPGLTIVSVVGMAVAIAIGAGAFAFLGALLDADLPLPEGRRIVAIQNNTDDPGNPDRRALHDLEVWRTELETVRDVSAFTADRRNLILPGGEVVLIRVALMTASGFRVARVRPFAGRYLTDEDEEPGAPPVLVVAHEEWQRRFDGDPDIVGRTVRLGDTPHTVVGVMPEGFRFPLSHRYWAPLRLDPSAHPRGGGPALNVFARLDEGQGIPSAQAELATVGARLAADHPDTHARLRPTVLPYPHMFTDIDTPFIRWLVRGFRMLVGLLLVIVAANVSVLVYARTAMRVGEIAVRSALGASRRRVVTQLFAEGLVLSLLSAGLGLGIGALGLAKVSALIRSSIAGEELPFWLDLSLSADEVVYVVALTLVAGAIVGVLPALKATGPSLYAGLKPTGAGGSRGSLGRTWTAMIVLQVALAVAVLPFALFVTGAIVGAVTGGPGYAADEVLRGYLSMERLEAPPADRSDEYEQATRARYLASAAALLERLESEPAVAGATFSAAFPGEERLRWVEVEGRRDEGGEAWVRLNRAAPDLPALFDFPILAGRGFRPADTLASGRTVIVDRVFAARLLAGARMPPTYPARGSRSSA